jgi:DNA repair protein RadC
MKTYNSTLPRIELKKIHSDFKNVQIHNSKDSSDYIRQFFSTDLEIYESFFLLLLNRSNRTIGYVKISQGGCVGTIVDVKIIAKYCIESLAQGVILCHNHPSGNTSPSESDIAITKNIKTVLALFECQVLDHIILTDDNFYSMADNCRI